LTRKGIIFTDIDGTLVFQKKFHGLRELRHNPDGTVAVEDPLTGQTVRALDVSVPPVVRYLAESTRQLAHCLREYFYIVFTTGATEGTMRMRVKQLDFADAYILEHGGRILDSNFKEDPQWAEIQRPSRDAVAQIRSDLENAGWRIILDADRFCSVQIRGYENLQRTEEEFQHLCRTFEVPDGFVKTFNLGDLTILPVAAGKGRAVAYYLRQNPAFAEHSIGLGDDLNDLDFLRICRSVCVPGSALPEVLREARQRGWCVSSQPHFQGIDEILTTILNER
jgi:hypothetical protein